MKPTAPLRNKFQCVCHHNPAVAYLVLVRRERHSSFCCASLGLSSYAVAGPLPARDLGLLTNYYGDCPARTGPDAGASSEHHPACPSRRLRRDAPCHHARKVFFLHPGDNERLQRGPTGIVAPLLGTLDMLSSLLVSLAMFQHATLAVFFFPSRFSAFERRFPKTGETLP